jgi:quercetin dioxygenase-like cupin family protein
MSPVHVDPEKLDWESWPEHPLVDAGKVRWKLLISQPGTPTQSMSTGLAEIAPRGVLPRHRHAPPEIYYGLGGEGEIEIEQTVFGLRPGQALFIPPNAWHRTANFGLEPFRFLFVFPTNALENVGYDFQAL